MPDDRSLFDDEDNQIPDWMRALEPDAFDASDDDTPPQPVTPPAPWERRPGHKPPARPAEPPRAAPPWQPPAEVPGLPADEPSPWEMLEEPAPVGDFDSFDWSVFSPRPDEQSTPEPDIPEAPPAPEPAPDEEAPLIAPEPTAADWWRVEAEITPPPADAGEEAEFDWLSPTTPEPAAERPPDAFDELEGLFGAQEEPPPTDQPTVPPVAPSAHTGRTGALRWLDQFGDRPAAPEEPPAEEAPAEPGAIPDWLRGATVDEWSAPAEPGAEEWPAAAPDLPADDDVPAWFHALDEPPAPAEPAPPAWADFAGRARGGAGAASGFDFDAETFAEPETPPSPGAPRADDLPFWLGEPEGSAAEGGDFVERFEPLAPDEFPAAPAPSAPPEPEAPDWLRDMAGGAPPRADAPDSFFDTLPPVAPPPGAAYVADADDLDWLNALDEGALEEAEEAPAAASEAAWRGEETFEGDLDSLALDALLGLAADEAREEPAAPPYTPPFSAAEDLGAFFDEPGAAAPVPELPEVEVPEVGGVPDPFAGEPDLGVLLAESGLEPDDLPDLEALLRDAEQRAAGPAPAEAAPPAPPEKGRGLFGRRRKGEKEPPAPIPDWLLAGEGEPPPAVEEPQPEWVEELRPSDVPVTIKAGGAEAAIRQKHVAELPERLQAFREESLRELGGAPPTPPVAPPPPAELFPPGEVEHMLGGLVITRAQQSRVDRLRAMLESAAEAEEAPARAGARAKRRTRRRKLDRLLITLLVLIAVAAPFATDAVYFADDPPPLAGAGLAVAQQVEQLEAGDAVLVAFEYGPLSAGVLDPLAQAVLRDALAQGAIPLTLSTNPAGALHAVAVLDGLAHDPALLAARGRDEARLEPGQDYVLLRYLPGEAIGVRALGGVARSDGRLLPHPAFERDLYGAATNLSVRSLQNDIALVVVASDDATAVRTWAEQIPRDAAPKVALVTASIEPLTIPYVDAGAYRGYLADVRDTLRYDKARNAATRTPYRLPADLPVTLPDPEASRWHSLTLGAAAAAGLIALGTLLNLLRAVPRRRRR